jgi:hypothetical protein
MTQEPTTLQGALTMQEPMILPEAPTTQAVQSWLEPRKLES